MEKSSLRIIVPAISGTVVGVLPVFLLGGLASFVRADLGFDEATLGLIVAVFYAVSSVAAIPAGGFADRIGAGRGLIAGVSLAAIALLGMALLAGTVVQLALFMAVAGCANAVMQPSANLALVRGIAPDRLGMAFGFKQSAVPGSTLLAGLAVPLIALTFGWRWAFVGGALAALLLLALLGKAARPSQRSRLPQSKATGTLDRREKLSLVRAGIAAGCGFVAANSLGVFYVQSAELTGIPVGTAGLMLSLGSTLAVVFRMVLGWRADRRGGNQLRIAGFMITIGTAGFFLLAHATEPVMLLVATFLCFAAGWGWTGLVHLGVVQTHPEAPATASGILNSGSLIGALTGPPLFGWIVTMADYTTAWTSVAIIALFGGALLIWEHRPTARRA